MAACIDKVTRHIASPVHTRVHQTFADFVNHLLSGNTELGDSSASGLSLMAKSITIKCTEKEIFLAFDHINVLTPKFYTFL